MCVYTVYCGTIMCVLTDVVFQWSLTIPFGFISAVNADRRLVPREGWLAKHKACCMCAAVCQI